MRVINAPSSSISKPGRFGSAPGCPGTSPIRSQLSPALVPIYVGISSTIARCPSPTKTPSNVLGGMYFATPSFFHSCTGFCSFVFRPLSTSVWYWTRTWLRIELFLKLNGVTLPLRSTTRLFMPAVMCTVYVPSCSLRPFASMRRGSSSCAHSSTCLPSGACRLMKRQSTVDVDAPVFSSLCSVLWADCCRRRMPSSCTSFNVTLMWSHPLHARVQLNHPLQTPPCVAIAGSHENQGSPPSDAGGAFATSYPLITL